MPLTYVAPTTKIMCDHVRRLAAEPAEDEEFMRAKNQLKSMVFMNLEQRSVYCEEIGQQFLSFNRHKPPEQWAREINAVKKEDIMAAVQEALKFPVAYSVFGKDVTKEVNSLPPVEGIRSYLQMPYKWCVCFSVCHEVTGVLFCHCFCHCFCHYFCHCFCHEVTEVKRLIAMG